jgi:enolase
VNQFLRDFLYQSKQMPGAVNKCVTEQGSLTCTLDTPQQGLEMIENAINAVCSSEMSLNLQIALNVSANELFDSVSNLIYDWKNFTQKFAF